MSAHNDRVRQLLVKQELSELLWAFSRAVDRGDAEAIASLFHDGAIIDTGVIREERKNFAREYVEWSRQNARTLFHLNSNEHFEIDKRRARGESYIFALSAPGTSTADRFDYYATGGRYLDRFEKRRGTWRFTERRFVLDTTIRIGSADVATIVAQASGMLTGRSDDEDPSFDFWRQRDA